MNFQRRAGTKRRGFVRWAMVLLTLATFGMPWATSVGSAQIGILRGQTPELWDAVERRYEATNSGTYDVRSIDIQIGEFPDGSGAYRAISTVKQKIQYTYAFGYDVVQVNAGIYELPHFQALNPDQVAQIKYNIFTTRDSSGLLYADLLFGRDNRLVIVGLTGNQASINYQLDKVAHSVWTALGDLPPDTLTHSDQQNGTGLWSLLTLPSTIAVSAFEVSDHLPLIFTGLDPDFGQTTPALDSGLSAAPPALTLATSTEPGVDQSTSLGDVTPESNNGRAANASFGVQNLGLTVILTGSAFTVTPFGVCVGAANYADFRADATIQVRNAAGNVVAQTIGGPSRLGEDYRGQTCSADIDIPDIPLGSPNYLVLIGDTIVGTTVPPGRQYQWIVQFIV